MQIGHPFKLLKLQVEHAMQIIMDHQQDNAFKMEQMVIGVVLSIILALVTLTLAFLFFISKNSIQFKFNEIAIMCSSETYDNANWISIQTSQIASGTCNANYYGSPTRQCTQNGTNGVWDTAVTNPCIRNIFFSSSTSQLTLNKTVTLCPSFTNRLPTSYVARA